jgi:molybdenum cofactor biosynthesis protein B
MHDATQTGHCLRIAILTISDTRCLDTDTSGGYLQQAVETSNHILADRQFSTDDIYQIRAIVSAWIQNPTIDVVLTTGGTGFTQRDSTPEALQPLFDKKIEGFGELFRQISFQQIGTSTIQSRCFAGLANKTLIFCMPGSTGACKTAWEGILREQFDVSHRPCNFVKSIDKDRDH